MSLITDEPVRAPFLQRLFARRARGKYKQCVKFISDKKKHYVTFCSLVEGHWFRHKTFDGLKWVHIHWEPKQ